MKKFQYALAAALLLLAVGCDQKEPNKPSDEPNKPSEEDSIVKFKQDLVLTNVEFIEDHDGMGNVIAMGDDGVYSTTLCIKGTNFVDGTYAAKCVSDESQVWGFLYNMNDFEATYTIDSISATVKKYADEGRLEITAKYYTAAHDSLYTIHFGQQITPVANKTIDITDAEFYDFTSQGGYFTIANANSDLKAGDFLLVFTYYATQFAGSYSVTDFSPSLSSFGYIEDTETGTLEKELTALYGTLEVKEAGTEGYTAVLKVMASDSVFYTINISGRFAETGYAIDATEDTEYAFDAATTTAQYSYQTQDGSTYAAFVLNDGTKYLQFIAFYEGDKDAVTIVPAGAYYIGTYYTSGTIAAGFYNAESQELGNSYFAAISGQNLTDPVYCLTEGAIVLSNEDGKCKIEVYATNSKNAAATVTYTGTLTEAKSTSNAPMRSYGVGTKPQNNLPAFSNIFIRR